MSAKHDSAVLDIAEQDLIDLKKAVKILENPGLVMKMTNLVGSPIEAGVEMLPDNARDGINKAVEISLDKALAVALLTMSGSHRQLSSDWLHIGLVTATGAAGGFVGLAGLPVELPITTVIMLRSIADIARSEGEDIHSPEAVISCLEVFSLGSPKNKSDDAAESGYFIVRAALSKTVQDAVVYLATKEASDVVGRVAAGSVQPVLLRLIEKIASYFGVAVTTKAAAQLVPIIGAIGGAAVNTVFIDHYQDMARGHFIVRRLERFYGEELVRNYYVQILVEQNKAV